MNDTEPQQPPQVGGSALNVQLDTEPNLHAEFAPGCTWADKKRLCISEAIAYWCDDVPMTENPYFENTWPWKWFNDEYHRLCD
jgi:hypothetical protein